jgi:hypothetical protein
MTINLSIQKTIGKTKKGIKTVKYLGYEELPPSQKGRVVI